MKKQEQSVKNGHIRSGILIGLWFLLLAVPVWFVNTTAGYFGTIFAILLVLFSFGILFILKRSVAVEASFLDMACIRGKRVDIGLFIRNRSPFIAPRAHTTFFLSDLFDRPAQKKGIDFVVGGKARNDFSFRTQMNHIGVFRVGMDDLRIWDMFGLVSIRIPVPESYQVTVLPRLRSIEEILEADGAETENDLTGGVQTGGMDYAGVRDYALGDSMKQIHWKLSAHMRGYLTKLTETNLQKSYAVILDLTVPGDDTEDWMDLNDCLIETACSIVRHLRMGDESCSLLHPGKNGQVRKIDTQELELLELIQELPPVFPPGKEEIPDGACLMREEGQMASRSSNVILCTALVSDMVVEELEKIKRQQRAPELFYIFSEHLNSRERESLAVPLGALDDAGIPYHLCSTILNQSDPELGTESESQESEAQE